MAESLQVRFGSQVAFHRKRHRLTQPKFATMVGLSASAISKLENGVHAPEFSKIESIANALEIQPADLFSSGATTLTGNSKIDETVAKLSKLSARDLDLVLKIVDRISLKNS